MRSLFCGTCKKFKNIVSFERDNPVLLCGHIITESRNELLSQGIYSIIREKVYDIMREDKISYKDAVKKFWIN